MNILIAGNGLDLHHGYKTGYVDFLKYAKEQGWDKNCFIREFISEVEADGVLLENYDPADHEKKKWIDCEDEIKTTINTFVKALPSLQFDSNSSIHAKVYKSFNPIINDGVYGDFASYHDTNGIFQKELFVERLRMELDESIRFLREYLMKAPKPPYTVDPFTSMTFNYAVSFNYTNVVERYVTDPNNVYYLHGSLEDDNMVLGTYGIDDIDFVYFEKYFQRIQKKTKWFDIEKEDTLNGVHNYFFGCSFGESDTDLMQKLLRMDLMIKGEGTVVNHIYYYGQKDYEQKIINLIKILDKDNFVKWNYEGKFVFINTKQEEII